MDAVSWGLAIFAVSSLCIGIYRFRRASHAPEAPTSEMLKPVHLVFCEDRLIDADDRIWALLHDRTQPQTWASVRTILCATLHDLPRNPLRNTRGINGSRAWVLPHERRRRVPSHPVRLARRGDRLVSGKTCRNAVTSDARSRHTRTRSDLASGIGQDNPVGQ